MKLKLLIGLGILLFVIQFIPIDKSNPEIDPQLDFFNTESLSTQETTLLKHACQDCHSHSTQFPSYTRWQPIGWFTKSHVKGGRQKLNFSIWNSYTQKQKNHHLIECIEVIDEKRMPMKSYTWMHAEAKLDDTKQALLKDLFNRLQK